MGTPSTSMMTSATCSTLAASLVGSSFMMVQPDAPGGSCWLISQVNTKYSSMQVEDAVVKGGCALKQQLHLWAPAL
jgi:hypothetical protein